MAFEPIDSRARAGRSRQAGSQADCASDPAIAVKRLVGDLCVQLWINCAYWYLIGIGDVLQDFGHPKRRKGRT